MVDEISNTLNAFTEKFQGWNACSFLNNAFLGSRIQCTYVKAGTVNVEYPCVTISRTIHPLDYANLLRLWENGNGFRKRWLPVALKEEVTPQREAHELQSRKTDPINFTNLFLSLKEYFKLSQDNIIDGVASQSARDLVYTFSETNASKRETLRNTAKKHKRKEVPFTRFNSKAEDLAQKLALIMHVFENAEKSYRETGETTMTNTLKTKTIENYRKTILINITLQV